MSRRDLELVTALLYCAAESNLHDVARDLAPFGRLRALAWEAFYRAGCDARAAAEDLRMVAAIREAERSGV